MVFSVCSHTPHNHPKYADLTSKVMVRLLDSLPGRLSDGRPASVIRDDCVSDSWSQGPPILQWPPANCDEPNSVSQASSPLPPVVAWLDAEGGAKVRSDRIGGEEMWISLDDDDDALRNLKAPSVYLPPISNYNY